MYVVEDEEKQNVVKTRESSYVPPRSPEPLIQELYVGTSDFPWKVLILCSMLNRTSRKQVEPVAKIFFERYPSPEDLIVAEDDEVEEIVRSLGFSKKRAKSLKQTSLEFLTFAWDDVSEVHGVGKYARDAWAIFVEGRWKEVEPDDHALNDYHDWISKRDELAEIEEAYAKRTAEISAAWNNSKQHNSGSFRATKRLVNMKIQDALSKEKPEKGDLVWVVKPFEDRLVAAEVVAFSDRHVTFWDDENEYLFGSPAWNQLANRGYVVKVRQKYQRIRRLKEEETEQ